MKTPMPPTTIAITARPRLRSAVRAGEMGAVSQASNSGGWVPSLGCAQVRAMSSDSNCAAAEGSEYANARY